MFSPNLELLISSRYHEGNCKTVKLEISPRPRSVSLPVYVLVVQLRCKHEVLRFTLVTKVANERHRIFIDQPLYEIWKAVVKNSWRDTSRRVRLNHFPLDKGEGGGRIPRKRSEGRSRLAASATGVASYLCPTISIFQLVSRIPYRVAP